MITARGGTEHLDTRAVNEAVFPATVWATFGQANTQLIRAIRALKEFAPEGATKVSQIAQLYMLNGFTYVIAGESFCNGIPVGNADDLNPTTEILSNNQLFEKAIAINLVGTFRCIAKSAAGMVTLDPVDEAGSRGAIVNTASVAAQDGQIGQAAYSASKGGVLAMTLPVARDLMNDGVRVNTILPGIFETPMMAGMPQQVQDALAAMVPFPKRLGKPEEYAKLALFMIEHDYLNGESVRLDGAIRLGPK